LASFSISTNTPSGIICAGQSAQLSVNLVSGYTYQWVKDNLDIAGQTSNVLNVTTEGTYKVRVTRTTAPTCSTETTTLDVDVYSLPVAAFTVDATACTQETLNFTSTSAVDNRATLVFAWAFGDTGTSTLQNPTHAYATAQTFNPVLTISYSGITGCEDNQAGTVTVAEAIVPDIVSDKTEICPGETAVLSVAGSFASLQWNTGATTPNITVTLPGNYNVASVDANGCEASDDIGIGSSPGCGEIDLTPPKAFTPDGKGDPATETWIIPGIDNYAECTMRIFDGRGSRVLEVKGYTNPGWDGKVNGKDVPEGTYFYVLACPTGKPLTGSVLIIRQK
jgi:gliding motility-associated-like protein